VIGGNYYITSERFLDHRVSRYPAHCRGGNGQSVYADVEAVRVLADGVAGAGALLMEAWERYRRPLAITETHLGSGVADQMRWLAQIWQEASALEGAGVDLRAVTIWALVGAWDWHCLATTDEGRYEPGVYDCRAGSPRPTALANLARRLAAGQGPAWSATESPGWWERPERLLYPAVDGEGNDVLTGAGRGKPRRLEGVA
jgi:dTDP-4-dehydrorhamnose reductase